MKKFECLPLGKELKAKADIAKKTQKQKQKQFERLDNTFEFDKTIIKEKPSLKKYNRSNLIYDSKYSFYPYYNIKNFNSLSLGQNINFYSCCITN